MTMQAMQSQAFINACLGQRPNLLKGPMAAFFALCYGCQFVPPSAASEVYVVEFASSTATRAYDPRGDITQATSKWGQAAFEALDTAGSGPIVHCSITTITCLE